MTDRDYTKSAQLNKHKKAVQSISVDEDEDNEENDDWWFVIFMLCYIPYYQQRSG